MNKIIETAIDTNVQIWIEGLQGVKIDEDTIRGYISTQVSISINKFFEKTGP